MHFLWMNTHTNTHTPWRIDKQAPGTDNSSLNKQPLLCLQLPTRPHLSPHGCHIPIHHCTQIHTQTQNVYMKTWKRVMPHSHSSRPCSSCESRGHRIWIRVLSFSHISSPGLTLGNIFGWQSFPCCKRFPILGHWKPCPFLLTAQKQHWYSTMPEVFGCV